MTAEADKRNVPVVIDAIKDMVIPKPEPVVQPEVVTPVITEEPITTEEPVITEEKLDSKDFTPDEIAERAADVADLQREVEENKTVIDSIYPVQGLDPEDLQKGVDRAKLAASVKQSLFDTTADTFFQIFGGLADSAALRVEGIGTAVDGATSTLNTLARLSDVSQIMILIIL